MSLKMIPLDSRNKPLCEINKRKRYDAACKGHYGNFGILTGPYNGLIAIHITANNINYNYPLDKKYPVITTGTDFDKVLNMKSNGYIIGKCETDFKILNFNKFLIPILILGEGCYVPNPGNITESGSLYNSSSDISKAPEMNITEFLKLYSKLSNFYSSKNIFFERHNWKGLYRRYLADWEHLSDNIYLASGIYINVSNGLFRVDDIIGFPDDFLRDIVGEANINGALTEHCGEHAIHYDPKYIIYGAHDGYYLGKNGKDKKITNWTTDKVYYINDFNGGTIRIVTEDGKVGFLDGIDRSTPYRLRRALSRYGLFCYTKSDTLLYPIISHLMEIADSSKVAKQGRLW
jgi:hypothetical protein